MKQKYQAELREHGLTGFLLPIGRFNYIGWPFATPWAPAYNVRANGLPSSPRAGGVRS